VGPTVAVPKVLGDYSNAKYECCRHVRRFIGNEQVCEAVTLWISTREVLSSTLTEILRWVSQPLFHLGVVLRLTRDRFLTNPFPINEYPYYSIRAKIAQSS
jgi:hypothetical protein